MSTTVLAPSPQFTRVRPPSSSRPRAATTVSVCLPARNEAATIGPIVEAIRDRADRARTAGRRDPGGRRPLHRPHRPGGRHRRRPGRRRVRACSPSYGEGHGKGEVLWKSVHASRGRPHRVVRRRHPEFGPRFVTGLLGPLLTDPTIEFVKGFYDRPDARADGGGRVTELVARPLLSLLLPRPGRIVPAAVGRVRRPARRARAAAVRRGLRRRRRPADRHRRPRRGRRRSSQVDLDVRHHRNRRLDELVAPGHGRPADDPAPGRSRARRAARPTLRATADAHRRRSTSSERPPLVELDRVPRRTA